jgi:ubiquinone/menaquinone biosynthesis C-methylase UbiE
MTQMYADGARVYDALNRHKDYTSASATLCQLLNRVVPAATTLLDVACGTGQHLSHLRKAFRVEGLDLSREMLDVARERCPDVPLHEGSLIDFRLNRQFDVVTCLFGSIGYALNTADLRRAVRCMANHVRPGGAVVVEPWISPERFLTDKIVFDSVNDQGLKVSRMYVTERKGRIAVYDQHYLVATTHGVKYFSEREELGLFSEEEYRSAFHAADLDVLDSPENLFGYGLFVCLARNARS